LFQIRIGYISAWLENLLFNRRIVIVGGTSGIGWSAASFFIKQGAKVIVTGSDREKANRIKSQMNQSGFCMVGDASKEGITDRAIGLCVENFDGFDGLYHVAGGSGRKWGDGPIHEMTLEAWERTITLNLTSVMLSNRAAIRYFLDHKQTGSILNMSSVLGFSPAPKYFTTHAYATAKAAVLGLSRSLAASYAADDIRINVIAPALTETPMSERAVLNEEIIKYIRTKQPLDGGRVGRVTDLDLAAAYFLSDYAPFTTGQVLAVDGAWMVTEGQFPT